MGMPVVKVTAKLEGIGPISFSRYLVKDRRDNESEEDADRRVWIEKAHWDSQGQAYIPPVALQRALAATAKYLGKKIPGKGQATWTKHFEAGVIVESLLMLPYFRKDVEAAPGKYMECINANSDGVRGGGKRVPRYFPTFPQWETTASILVIDPVITEEAFTDHLEATGQFNGLGRYRVRQGGSYGRFMVKDMKWTKVK